MTAPEGGNENRKCRRSLSSGQSFPQAPGALKVNQIGNGSVARFTLIHPDALFFLEKRLGSNRPQGNALAFTFHLLTADFAD